MKILLIAQDIDSKIFFKEMAVPLGLCYLASYITHYFKGDIKFKIIRGDETFKPEDFDLIGISSMSFHFPAAIATAESIKKICNIPVLIGGPHISTLPVNLPREFDIGVIGEGEETFLELINLYKEKGIFIEDDLKNIKGISFHNNDSVEITASRPLISNIDSIPPPDRKLWDLKGKMKQVFSGRGCPCKCHFCAIPDNRYRKFSLDYIITDLLFMKEQYNISAVIFQDEIFSMKKQWLLDLLEKMKNHNLHRDMSYFISSRADLIDEETADILKEMNVKCIFIGIESGSDKILQYLKSGKITIKDIQKALDILAEKDIQVEGSFILGSPDEGHSELKETYDFIYKNNQAGKLDLVNIFALIPFPGSGVWKDAMGRGLVNDDMDWSRLTSMPILEFNPERYIYLNRKMSIEKFTEYVKLFQELMVAIYYIGIPRHRKNILDPMDVYDFYSQKNDFL